MTKARAIVAAANERGKAASPRRAWDAVLGGTWALVDVVDDGPTRHLVFRPAAPRLRSPEGLTRREVLALAEAAAAKNIRSVGAALGVSTATAARIVERALKKLGVPNVVALARWVGSSSTES